uniref:ORF24 n=1 Tax=Fowl aviadenovirus 4 TaxID=130663 RepID=Q30BR2_FADV4|nr:ORF24 [Fowl aviadenovirus 4]
MFPFCRRDYVSADELFPKLEMPPFKVRLRLMNFYPYTTDHGAPAIRSECSCGMPHSLFCESLGQLVFAYWFETIQEFIEEHIPIDPFLTAPSKTSSCVVAVCAKRVTATRSGAYNYSSAKDPFSKT